MVRIYDKNRRNEREISLKDSLTNSIALQLSAVLFYMNISEIRNLLKFITETNNVKLQNIQSGSNLEKKKLITDYNTKIIA